MAESIDSAIQVPLSAERTAKVVEPLGTRLLRLAAAAEPAMEVEEEGTPKEGVEAHTCPSLGDELRTARTKLGEGQRKFWKRFGLVQSTGSRYETDGLEIPLPVLMLVAGYISGRLSDEDLNELKALAAKLDGKSH